MNLSPSDQELINRIPHINTKIGIIGVLGFREDIPQGWERLCLEEAKPYLQELKRIMTTWSIIAFRFHKYHGPGYKYSIEPSYGSECGQGFIIKHNTLTKQKHDH